jgi:hypothetical protein
MKPINQIGMSTFLRPRLWRLSSRSHLLSNVTRVGTVEISSNSKVSRVTDTSKLGRTSHVSEHGLLSQNHSTEAADFICDISKDSNITSDYTEVKDSGWRGSKTVAMLNFQDTEETYRSKSSVELVRSLLILKSCTYPVPISLS